ncbi:MAG: hypothetical protein KY443_02935 [Actinobacteria bacterium]|nr:hypothetical protein [Actinomycetota bacterium]
MTLREFLDRYGPALVVAAVVTLLVVILPGNVPPGSRDGDTFVDSELGGGDGFAVDGDGVGNDSAFDGPGGLGGTDSRNGSGPTGATGRRSGGASGETPPAPAGVQCRKDGRMPGIFFDMPPCVPVFQGDNGGATARGVTREKVVVARYVPPQDPATNAALVAAGAGDPPETVKRTYEVLRRYGNHHFETYGREIEFVDVPGSGPSDNETAMRSDAIRIAEEVKAFAVLQSSSSGVLSEELAQRGVHVIRFTAFSREFYRKVPPRIWAVLPTPEQYFDHLAEYIGKRLAGRNAEFAGDDEDPTRQQQFKTKARKFGLIWIEGAGSRVDPYAKPARDHFVRQLAKYGVTLAADTSYSFDIPRQQQQTTAMISKMRSAEVTSLAFFGEPIFPVFLTQEATRQNYYPEWIITGSLLTDTTFFGRTYDQRQWSHAFGISPLFVFVKDLQESGGYREYHHMAEGARHGDEGVGVNVVHNDVIPLFIGIQMAGPKLTDATFREGMLSFPAVGGSPTVPLLYWDAVDPVQYKDFTEVWWNRGGQGKDETGKDGVGILMKADGGRRFRAGRWPTTPPKAFDIPTSVFTRNPTGDERISHEEDGHRHPSNKRCRSCG